MLHAYPYLLTAICASQDERNRIENVRTEIAALHKIIAGNNDDAKMEAEARLRDIEHTAYADLTEPIGWPITMTDDGEECRSSGIPINLPSIIQFVPPESLFNAANDDAFAPARDLPVSIVNNLTLMLYGRKRKRNVEAGQEDDGELLDPYSKASKYARMKHNLDAFVGMNSLASEWFRFRDAMKEEDPIGKIELYKDHLQNSMRILQRLALDKKLLSDTVYFMTKYVQAGDLSVCEDLRELVDEVGSELHQDVCEGDCSDAPWRNNPDSMAFWTRSQMCPVLAETAVYDIMMQRFNVDYFSLTPQNLRIANEFVVSIIMWMNGSDDFTQIGMPTWVVDAGLNLKIMVNGAERLDSRKMPSAGLDLTRGFVDSMLESGKMYTGMGNVDDGQKPVQGRRWTEGSVQQGYVTFVDGEIARRPTTELMRPIFLPEGPPDKFDVINAIVNAIPRDAGTQSELFTTVDPKGDNNRANAFKRLIPGMWPYFMGGGCNFELTGANAGRWMDALICFNIEYSSGAVDFAGVNRTVGNDRRDALDRAEDNVDRDRTCRVSAVSLQAEARNRKTSDVPPDVVKKKHAPFRYFVYACCVQVALANKLGLWKQTITYHVKHLSGYMYNFIIDKLNCLILPRNVNNVSRYHQQVTCRFVSHNIQKRVFGAMMDSDTLEDAKVLSMQRIQHDSLHLSMLPAMFEKFLRRIVRFDIFIAMGVIAICLDVPVLPLSSMLQFLDGRAGEMPRRWVLPTL